MAGAVESARARRCGPQGRAGVRAVETAELLDTTEASVNSALQRAREKLDRLNLDRRGADAPAPSSAAERDIVGRFVRAFEGGDVGSVVARLSEDAKLTMAPGANGASGGPAARAGTGPRAARRQPGPLSELAKAPGLRPLRDSALVVSKARSSGLTLMRMRSSAEIHRSPDEFRTRFPRRTAWRPGPRSSGPSPRVHRRARAQAACPWGLAHRVRCGCPRGARLTRAHSL
jgi:hypothetical protein